MKSIKINKKQKPLTDAEIKGYQNFDQLLSNHSKLVRYKEATKPLYKNWRFMTLVALISTLILVFIIDTQESSPPVNEPTSPVRKDSSINAPIQQESQDSSEMPIDKVVTKAKENNAIFTKP